MNVSLTPKLEKWVQEKVSTGMYSSSSEVVREAIRVMAQYEKSRQEKLDSLRTDILLGVSQVDSGNVVVFDETELGSIKSEARESSKLWRKVNFGSPGRFKGYLEVHF